MATKPTKNSADKASVDIDALVKKASTKPSVIKEAQEKINESEHEDAVYEARQHLDRLDTFIGNHVNCVRSNRESTRRAETELKTAAAAKAVFMETGDMEAAKEVLRKANVSTGNL